MKHLPKIIVLLILAGIGVSTYLYLKTSDPSSIVCSIGGGCEKVLSSQYAKIAGFPVAGMGLIWYIAALILSWFVYFKRTVSLLPFRVWMVTGLVFSLYLLGLEIFIIKYYCTWCLVSLAIVWLLTILSFVTRK